MYNPSSSSNTAFCETKFWLRVDISKYIYVNQNPTTLGVAISLSMGLRIGELCALQWSDIDMEILEGILDSGSGAELQQARQTLNNTRKLTPDGGYIYPVKFNPTNWFELLNTSFTPIDLLKTPDVLSSELSTFSTRRIALNAKISEISSLIPDDATVQAAEEEVNTAKSTLDQAQSGLIESYGNGIKTLLNTVFDIAHLFAGGVVPTEIISRLATGAGIKKDDIEKLVTDLNAALKDNFEAQQKYVNASQKLADASAKAVQAESLAALKQVLVPLKEQLEELNIKISDLQTQIQLSSTVNSSDGGNNETTPPTVPEGYTQVLITADAASLDKATSSSATSNVSTSGVSFWFCGYHSEKSNASSSFSDMTDSQDTEIQIGMNVAKVGIEREWFNPGVFALTKDMFNVTTLKIAPNPNIPYTSVNDARIKDMATNGNVFPCYPTAMVIARDISVKLKSEKNFSSEFSSMVENHASSGGGFLIFSGSSSSSNKQSTSGVHTMTTGNTVTLKFDTPQIIGYYMEATAADKSVYLDDTAGDSQAGYVTISKFVEDYKKILEAMNKKEK